MKTSDVELDDLSGVIAVPPLARLRDAGHGLDEDQNQIIADYLMAGGLERLLFGGNAFLYHLSLRDYEQLLEWSSGLPGKVWVIPSAGPSYGRALDQAAILRCYPFPCFMMLPCADPRDAEGLEKGFREVAQAAGKPLIIYLKEESSFGNNLEKGLDAVQRLIEDGTCVAIKYAVVRTHPGQDAYLEGLLKRVDRRRVVSGIGERPAVVHMRDFKLPGFTTGSGCLAPSLSRRLFEACQAGDFWMAEQLRDSFLSHEDLRDLWGPARVLHHSVELAGIARTGPILPFLSGLTAEQTERLEPVARRLKEENVSRIEDLAI